MRSINAIIVAALVVSAASTALPGARDYFGPCKDKQAGQKCELIVDETVCCTTSDPPHCYDCSMPGSRVQSTCTEWSESGPTGFQAYGALGCFEPLTNTPAIKGCEGRAVDSRCEATTNGNHAYGSCLPHSHDGSLMCLESYGGDGPCKNKAAGAQCELPFTTRALCNHDPTSGNMVCVDMTQASTAFAVCANKQEGQTCGFVRVFGGHGVPAGWWDGTCQTQNPSDARLWCSALHRHSDAAAAAEEDDDGWSGGVIALIVILTLVIACLLGVILGLLWTRRRAILGRSFKASYADNSGKVEEFPQPIGNTTLAS
mmetsp:Transcript_26523/g.61910  ORF Transcript_26523/g.61910 Transcript_26523/m.61910 type:complete len:315 (-) Transcript_26523:132-1076(-)